MGKSTLYNPNSVLSQLENQPVLIVAIALLCAQGVHSYLWIATIRTGWFSSCESTKFDWPPTCFMRFGKSRFDDASLKLFKWYKEHAYKYQGCPYDNTLIGLPGP